jgi:hypothetical protein
MYYFIDWKQIEEGKAANLPDEIDYIMLAEPSYVSDYALFECVIPDEYEEIEAEFAEPVSAYLYDLLNSAKSYPPALALTRKGVRGDAKISRSDFAKKLISSLEFHLENQRISPYFMARKINPVAVWNSKGGFYWIVDYHKSHNASDRLSFVSDDYYICNASIGDFEIEIEEVEKRFLK